MPAASSATASAVPAAVKARARKAYLDDKRKGAAQAAPFCIAIVNVQQRI
jgi:hypothetical protein